MKKANRTLSSKKVLIAIIGDQELAKALVSGLLYAGYEREDILILARTEGKTDFTFFYNHKIRVLEDRNQEKPIQDEIELVTKATHIILAVDPCDITDELDRLQELEFSRDAEFEIISCVPALTVNRIQQVFGGGIGCKIILMTCNMGINHCHGIICTTRDSGLLSNLGMIMHETARKMIKSYVTVTKMNEHDCRAIVLSYGNSTIPFSSWVKNLLELLRNPLIDLNQTDPVYSSLLQYLFIKSQIFQNKHFRYSRAQAKKYSISTMQSVLETLIEIKDYGTLSYVEWIISIVVRKETGNGKNIRTITTVEQLTSKEFIEEHVFIPALQQAFRLKKSVRKNLLIQ